jgi:Ku protein
MEKVSFNRINRKTGNRLKQQNVDSETGEEVPREDIARGYEVGKGQYLIVEDDELEAVQVESTRTIEIDQFVPRNEIDDPSIRAPFKATWATSRSSTPSDTPNWHRRGLRACFGIRRVTRAPD